MKAGQDAVRVAVVNCYLEGRETACERNEYPRSHLWGADVLTKEGMQVTYLRPERNGLTRFLGKLSAALKWRLGNLDFDLELIRRAGEFDLIYVPNGRLLFYQCARALGLVKAPLVYWTYTEPADRPGWKLWDLWEREPFRRGIDGLLCLTSAAAAAYRQKWTGPVVEHVEWTPDNIMFPGSDSDGEFYFACGRTNRDYQTLLKAAAQLDVPFVILASSSLVEGISIPSNVTFVEGPKDAGTDKGIPYPELIEKYYANAKAVCIPRKDLPSDTSGYTNLLEAIAMHRPVVITNTGKLDLDVEREQIGRLAEPDCVSDWVEAILEIESKPALRLSMRQRAKQLIAKRYNLQHHGAAVCAFIEQVLRRSQGSIAARKCSLESGAPEPRQSR